MPSVEKKSWVLNEKRRFVDWRHPNEGWDVFKDVLDQFIAEAIEDILVEYQGANVEWLEIVAQGPDGLVEVLPTQDGPFGDGGTRLSYRLFTGLLEEESNSDPSRDYTPDHEAISRRFWGLVEDCLKCERAFIALSKARRVHPMRLAAYAYDAGEGMHYLPDLVDPEFGKQYHDYLKIRGW